MRQFVVRIWLAEILCVMRDERETASRWRFRSDRICIDFNQNRIVDAVALSVEGSTFVYGTLRSAQFHAVRSLYNRRVSEELFDAADRVHGSLTQRRKPAVHVVELPQHRVLFPRVAKLLHGLLGCQEFGSLPLGQAAYRLLTRSFLGGTRFSWNSNSSTACRVALSKGCSQTRDR